MSLGLEKLSSELRSRFGVSMVSANFMSGSPNLRLPALAGGRAETSLSSPSSPSSVVAFCFVRLGRRIFGLLGAFVGVWTGVSPNVALEAVLLALALRMAVRRWETAFAVQPVYLLAPNTHANGRVLLTRADAGGNQDFLGLIWAHVADFQDRSVQLRRCQNKLVAAQRNPGLTLAMFGSSQVTVIVLLCVGLVMWWLGGRSC